MSAAEHVAAERVAAEHVAAEHVAAEHGAAEHGAAEHVAAVFRQTDLALVEALSRRGGRWRRFGGDCCNV